MRLAKSSNLRFKRRIHITPADSADRDVEVLVGHYDCFRFEYPFRSIVMGDGSCKFPVNKKTVNDINPGIGIGGSGK